MEKINEKKATEAMNGNEKVYKQSAIAIACYVIAAVVLVYACYTAGSTVKQINEYYGGYGMTASPKEYVTYVLQAVLDPLMRAILLFMAGYILTAVRKLDPKNYKERKISAKAVGLDNEAASVAEPVKSNAAKAKADADTSVNFEMKTEAKAGSDKDAAAAPKKSTARKSTAKKPASEKDADKDEKKADKGVKKEAKKDTIDASKKTKSAAKKDAESVEEAEEKAKASAEEVKETAAEKVE